MTRPRLTNAQRDVLSYIAHFHKKRGYGPAYRDIQRAFGFASVMGAQCHVAALLRKGYAARDANVARSIRVVGPIPARSETVRGSGPRDRPRRTFG